MKKYYFYSILIALTIIILVIFTPRTVEHAVVISSNYHTIEFFIDGKNKSVKSNLNLVPNTVVNYKYNLIKAYSFKEVSPISERIMVKNQNSYELEIAGMKSLNKKTYYYTIDSGGKIKPCTNRDLIIGKDNVKSYVSKNGNLKTFLIYPMDYNLMRVGISTTAFTSVYHTNVKIQCSNFTKLYCLSQDYYDEIPKDSLIDITYAGNKIKVHYGTKNMEFKSRVYIKGSGLIFSNIKRGAPSFTPQYNGVLEVSLDSKGIVVVNEVDIEEYLKRVVPSEMPLSGGLEALKCQSIAARTYAISDMLQNRFAELGFYVDDSTQSQVFNNTYTQPLSNKAVELTKGLIMTYNGKPIDAKYYSTSCGTGAKSKDIWFRADGSGDESPYLKNQLYARDNTLLPNNETAWLNFYKNTNIKAVDSNSPYFRWNLKFPKEALEASLNKSLRIVYDKRRDYISITQDGKNIDSFPELKNLEDIKIIKRGMSGNIIEMSYIFGSVTVKVKEDINIRGSIRCNEEFAGSQIIINRYKATPLNSISSLPSSFFSIVKDTNSFLIYGGGYGHGVGMSQYGAMELSKKGVNYKDILDTFYSDVDITKIN